MFPWFSHPNVVILTTSNVTEKIDLAFVDRADIKQYIGPPSASAIFNIYLSCLDELMKVRVCSAPLTVEHLHFFLLATTNQIWSFPAASDRLPQTAAAEFGGTGHHELHGERRDPSELKPEEHRPVSVCWWCNQYWSLWELISFTSVSFWTGGVWDSVEEPWGKSHFWLMRFMERYFECTMLCDFSTDKGGC